MSHEGTSGSCVERRSIEIHRPAFSQAEFDNEFQIKQTKGADSTKKLVRAQIKQVALKIHPKNLLGIFTILNLITQYDFKNNLIADTLSGFTGV